MTQTFPSELKIELENIYEEIDNMLDMRERGYRTDARWHEDFRDLQSRANYLELLQGKANA